MKNKIVVTLLALLTLTGCQGKITKGEQDYINTQVKKLCKGEVEYIVYYFSGQSVTSAKVYCDDNSYEFKTKENR